MDYFTDGGTSAHYAEWWKTSASASAEDLSQ